MDILTLHRNLLTANHILHSYSVLDAYGHISVRHPTDSSIFIMAKYLPAALVSAPSDLLEYRVSDAEPVDEHAPKGYTERFIHSEVYKRFPGAKSVCHSHSKEVIPFGLVGGSGGKLQLRACVNTSGFLGKTTPIFEPRPHFRPGDIRDLLIRSEHLGSALAAHFSNTSDGTQLDRSVVLMRGHGMTVAATSIEHCVFRAIYAQNNAIVQTTSLLLSNASIRVGEGEKTGSSGVDDLEEGLNFLDDDEVLDCTGINEKTVLRPWLAWSREVQAKGIYVNLA